MSDHDIWAPPPAANAGGIHWPPPPFQGRVRARPGRRAGLLVALLAVGALLGGIVAWQLMPDLRAEAEAAHPARHRGCTSLKRRGIRSSDKARLWRFRGAKRRPIPLLAFSPARLSATAGMT